MKKLFVFALMVLFGANLLAQVQVIQSFDTDLPADYWRLGIATNSTTDSAYININYQNTVVHDGAKAMLLDWGTQSSETWGGYSNIRHFPEDTSTVLDWASFDSVTFWYNNTIPQDEIGRVHLRFNLMDVSNSPLGDAQMDVNQTEYYYSFLYILDSLPGWHYISIPLKADPGYWSGEGFNRTGWTGVPGNNKLDLDKIKSFTFEFSTAGSNDFTHQEGTIVIDNMCLKGVAKRPLVFFNGKAVNSEFTLGNGGWNDHAFEVTGEQAVIPGAKSIKWTTSTWADYGGMNFQRYRKINMQYLWSQDSLKFAILAPAGFGNLILQFQDEDTDSTGPDLMFNAEYMLEASAVGHDGANWKFVSVPLRAFNLEAGGWNGSGTSPGTMDTTDVIKFNILTTNDANSKGKVVYISNIWTGSPFFDVVAPPAPTGVGATPGSYTNLITWLDVPGEDLETYNVYYALEPIVDLNQPKLEVAGSKVGEGIQVVEHALRAPLTDQNITYYYAVTCTDAAGNESIFANIDPVTNLAKGVSTVHNGTPPSFAADGNLGEWSAIAPFRLFPSDGSGTVVNNTTIDGDADCSALGYVAVDDNFMYVAFDVTDDVITVDTTQNTYLNDSPDLFIGLYDWHGLMHDAYQRGATPDYHFRYCKNGFYSDAPGGKFIFKNNPDYVWQEKFSGGYVVEMKISLDTLAAIGGDVRFDRAEGMRLPIDLLINDADLTGSREGMLTLSPNNQDQGWAHVNLWTYTWLGSTMVGVEDENSAPLTYSLEQNYPNPFNPNTAIRFSLKNASMVNISVYNVLGEKVATLLDGVRTAGTHEVNFDASNLASGLYIYRIQAGSFVDAKKMMLLK